MSLSMLKIVLNPAEQFILKQAMEGELARLNIAARNESYDQTQLKNIENNQAIVLSIMKKMADNKAE